MWRELNDKSNNEQVHFYSYRCYSSNKISNFDKEWAIVTRYEQLCLDASSTDTDRIQCNVE